MLFSVVNVNHRLYRKKDCAIFGVGNETHPLNFGNKNPPLSPLNDLGCSGQSGFKAPRMNSGPPRTQQKYIYI